MFESLHLPHLDQLLRLTTALTAHLARDDRYNRILDIIQSVIPCDAVAILKIHGDKLVPIAWKGLAPEVGGKQWNPLEHPRLKHILDYAHKENPVVRFPHDCDWPDPWDGFLESDPHACSKVHACMGCTLQVEGKLIGLLTVDALSPEAFDHLDDTYLAMFAAVTAAAIHSAGLVDVLEQINQRQGAVLQKISESQDERKNRMIGTSLAMEKLRSEIDTVAASDLSVLVLGETGVGKELVASAIHAASGRRSEPLITFNCATLSDSLAESQLFGHRRGAFTGATEHRIGLFEVADKGTVFLDEVGEIPLAIQAKLLRVLQEGQIQRMGESEPRKVDVRIVAATNRDLKKKVAEGSFREDLFYRLSVYPIVVPPLRDRRSDIPLIAGHFLDREARRLGLRSLRLNQKARDVIMQQAWPGNIRELEHIIMRAALRAGRRDREEVIELDDLELGPPPKVVTVEPSQQSMPSPSQSLREQQDLFTRKVIQDAMIRHQGNISAAGRELGQTPSNLIRIARRLDIRSK